MKFSDLVSFLCLVIALLILWQFRHILLLVFTAVVLAIAINALVRKLVRALGMKRGWAVLISFGLMLFIISVLLILVVPLVASQSQEIIQRIPEGFATLSRWLNELIANPPVWVPEWVPESDLQLPNFADLMQQISSLAKNIFGSFYTVFSGTFTVLLELLLVLVLTLMIVADPLPYRRLLLKLFPSSYRKRADEIFSKCEVTLLYWLDAVLLKSLFVGILSFFGLILIGVDYAFTHAVIAGLFNFIPNLGPLLSTVFPLSVALLNSQSQSLAVIILYIIIQNVETYLFGPIIIQRQVSLLPAATLIAQLFFTVFLGPLGLLLAIPLAIIAKIWIEEAWIKDVLEAEDSISKEPHSFP
jgi:predicted PurR-regulated permease PerM